MVGHELQNLSQHIITYYYANFDFPFLSKHPCAGPRPIIKDKKVLKPHGPAAAALAGAVANGAPSPQEHGFVWYSVGRKMFQVQLFLHHYRCFFCMFIGFVRSVWAE